MNLLVLLVPVILLIFSSKCHSLNILGLATYDGNSHWFVMKSVFEVLIKAGHHVTVVSPYTLPPSPNVTTIDVSKVLPPRRNSFTYDFLMKEYYKPWKALRVLPHLSLHQCDKIHAMDEVRNLVNGRTKFDIVITEIFGADCDAVFAHLLQVPLISVIASTHLPWASARVGNPENPAYVGHILLSYTEKMSFSQRLVNFFVHMYSHGMSLYYSLVTTSVNRKHFGEQTPAVTKILQNTSLIFVNSHVSVDTPRPFVPNIVEIGGIHLAPIKKLPDDMSEILDNAKKGVIYFSLGSIVKASSFPTETINAIKSTFAELEYEVLWKFEDETINVPDNVHVRKWFPQRDIFSEFIHKAHPKLKLAIIHGGLMSVYEAVDQGVPILGMPFFFDQHRNIMNLVSKGAALRMDIDKITKQSFNEKVRRLLDDPKFKEQSTKLSRRFHDRAMEPADSVVYWTEYVVRHEGAKHMKTTAADLSIYQLLLLDIFGFLTFISLVFIYVTVKSLKYISSLMSSTHKDIPHQN